eukprot:6175458-Pleurochrysis_carterae.AAC.4
MFASWAQAHRSLAPTLCDTLLGHLVAACAETTALNAASEITATASTTAATTNAASCTTTNTTTTGVSTATASSDTPCQSSDSTADYVDHAYATKNEVQMLSQTEASEAATSRRVAAAAATIAHATATKVHHYHSRAAGLAWTAPSNLSIAVHYLKARFQKGAKKGGSMWRENVARKLARDEANRRQ